MLFNKKVDEELARDLSTNPQSAIGDQPLRHTQQAMPRKAQARSVIDACLQINGTVEGDGELQVDGQVHGDIRCTHLTVGSKATVTGRIAADEVVVRGHVNGMIGANRVLLAEGARVESDIFHKKLAIEEGAHFEGEARVRENPFDELQAAAAEMKAAESAEHEPAKTEGAAR